jgi:membrane protein implicated in regulation of membrane protease activity
VRRWQVSPLRHGIDGATASGIAVLRYGALPRWLGYLALVAGVVSATPVGWVGAFLAILWVAIVSVVLFRQASGEAAGPTPQPAVPPAV